MQTTTAKRIRLRDIIPGMWWLVLLRGIAGVVLGVALFSQTSLDLLVLAQFMGLYWLVDGIIMSVASFMGRQVEPNWWWALVRGLIGIIAGVIVLGDSTVTNLFSPRALSFIIAAQAIAIGIIDLIISARLRQESDSEWTAMILSAVLVIVFGFLLIFSPQVTLALIVPIIGGFAILGGISAIYFAFRLRSQHKAAPAT